jgi:gamma-glutamyltranspeptidase/glutathione hydrolase
VVDKLGNAVSFIQSLFHSFGSGEVVPRTGIIMNNRMCGFSLAKDHPNRLEPGKRTAHTLNSYVLTKNDKLCMLGGTPGADDQVQVNLQVIANVIDYQMNAQQAIEAPRWSSKPGTAPRDENDPYELWVENRIPENVRHQLAAKGHSVGVAEAWSFGGSQAILIDQKNRVFMGGADPRRDGYAIGW